MILTDEALPRMEVRPDDCIDEYCRRIFSKLGNGDDDDDDDDEDDAV